LPKTKARVAPGATAPSKKFGSPRPSASSASWTKSPDVNAAMAGTPGATSARSSHVPRPQFMAWSRSIVSRRRFDELDSTTMRTPASCSRRTSSALPAYTFFPSWITPNWSRSSVS